ncbi:hypothetical protein DH2020_025742 [Rehmannia glutinosa]|uniref:Disease resistance RPP13-like protein 1 n=1 Tax=Rehmannia glutinosa TaxID=99300 RepID=A0ABR0VZS9_REHGL
MAPSSLMVMRGPFDWKVIWTSKEVLLNREAQVAYFTNASMFDDAENKQYENPAIETWLDMLKNVVYEVEDILDELATEALQCKLEMSPAWTFEREEIIKLQAGDDETSRTTPTILPILGMGGVGKTIVVQIIYNDKRVDEVFDIKAWAYVSDDFSLVRITKALLESATAKLCDTMNLELMQNGLKEIFNKKKFSIVLDDVWNEQLDSWNDLSIPFMVGNPGSKIIITTRNKSVMDALPPYYVKEMPDETCWSLFVHHAFGVDNSEMYSSLKETGRKIVKKCNGLPLALKTVGSALVSKLDNDHWNEVLNNKLWDIAPRKNVVLPSLRLSYHHLPSNLKQCFAYCSIFPKGYEFDKKNLVLLWMAEGFVQPVGNITLEEVGEAYFPELLLRSFFQESVQDKTRYIMHDLLNDLAQSVSKKICIHLEENWENRMFENFEKVHHFSCFRNKYDVYKKFESLNEAKWLRAITITTGR